MPNRAPGRGFLARSLPAWKMSISLILPARKELTHRAGENPMALFWEFFSLRVEVAVQEPIHLRLFRALVFARLSFHRRRGLPQSPATIRSFSTGPSPPASFTFVMSFFGMLVMAAIFGTSILRDFQRDTYQTHLHQTDHQVRLSGRPLGRLLRHRRFLLSAAWSSARPWARSLPGRTTPVSPPAISAGTCTHSYPSPWCRSSFLVRSSSPSPRSPASSSSSICRASLSFSFI